MYKIFKYKRKIIFIKMDAQNLLIIRVYKSGVGGPVLHFVPSVLLMEFSPNYFSTHRWTIDNHDLAKVLTLNAYHLLKKKKINRLPN